MSSENYFEDPPLKKWIHFYLDLNRVRCLKGERVSKGNDSDEGVYFHRVRQNEGLNNKKITLHTKYNDQALTSYQLFVHKSTYANRINNLRMLSPVIHFVVNRTTSKST